jgi:hypothetical protein
VSHTEGTFKLDHPQDKKYHPIEQVFAPFPLPPLSLASTSLRGQSKSLKALVALVLLALGDDSLEALADLVDLVSDGTGISTDSKELAPKGPSK